MIWPNTTGFMAKMAHCIIFMVLDKVSHIITIKPHSVNFRLKITSFIIFAFV